MTSVVQRIFTVFQRKVVPETTFYAQIDISLQNPTFLVSGSIKMVVAQILYENNTLSF